MKKKTMLEKGTSYGILGLFAVSTLFPYYCMVVMGTHSNAGLFSGLKLWFGDSLRENFMRLTESGYIRYFLNSLLTAVPATALTLLSGSMGGYALAKYQFRGKRFLITFVYVTLMLPGSLGTVAWVWEMKKFGWIDTYWPFIIPAMGNTYAVYWFMQLSKGAIPDEILDSARVDGAGEYCIFFRIASPHLLAGAASLGLLNFVGAWNSYLGPSLILKKQKLYTVPMGIATMGSQFRSEYSTQILGMTIATIPLILLFACTSRYFVAGIVGGSVKG